jgi:hypothetical protein
MNRPAVGYLVGGPIATGLPTDQPTRDTRRRYGTGAQVGILTATNFAAVVPLQKRTPATLGTPVFPYFQPSSVAPNAIRVSLGIALNLFSPQHHSTPPITQLAVPAVLPTKTMGSHSYVMPKKMMHGTGGWYVLPTPPVLPNWPRFMDKLPR